jgi:hypothetical protein
VNADGYSDILIGANLFDYVYGDAGYVFIFHGAGQGMSGGIPYEMGRMQESAQMGFAVGSAGDVNGDGYGDVIIGAPYFDNGQASEGRVYVSGSYRSGYCVVWMRATARMPLRQRRGRAGDVVAMVRRYPVGAPGLPTAKAEGDGFRLAWFERGAGSAAIKPANWKVEGASPGLFRQAAWRWRCEWQCFGDAIVRQMAMTMARRTKGQAGCIMVLPRGCPIAGLERRAAGRGPPLANRWAAPGSERRRL